MKIAKSSVALLAAALLALPAAAQSDSAPRAVKPAPDAPLVVEGDIRVNAADFDGNLLRIPEEKRAGFSMSYERVVSVVDNVFLARSFAKKARDLGLDKDPAVQARLKQVQEAFLADLYVQKIETPVADIDYERRARELYAAEKEKFMTDEEAHVQQILVGIVCRTKGAARDLARKAEQEARAGADFIELADRYSDPGEKAFRGGDIGTGPVKRLVEPVREALAKMKPGDISEPVESQFGFHVIKLIERKPSTVKPFEAVKAQLIAQERQRLQKKRIEDAVAEVRNSTTVVTYRDNVEKLVRPGLDVEDLTERARAKNRTAPTAVETAPK